ncbi:hypothetical protein FOPG_08580 [Fusarium oxysporum f. sp. conglutinans race 2 54008]|uniref:NAD dependent epimerase/dehydratase n=4 Tax=Fusarium oxysporum TaxID=5507 RepID=A0A8H6GBR8_FUSOX|nr:hypothetical protein FOXB_12010 [Fusarium oxysporum f. sp. conglutinans Fo5176]EXL76682.1 hypothetical protein FOPG_08580 [Fusarium oxysporum f. sp. conglutinans race 2 54008]KAF6514500.1 hypothetical protein HZS61_005634 [Fusarium oxysporum f. sp. conglutinans]KAI8400531.1 hypothetical protein FOFC_19373 [Fusarium oxysporum]KAG6978301.1 hypothetical protein FocnCong_v011910 [Fusarium oxysporum f. sp. conglutinans]
MSEKQIRLSSAPQPPNRPLKVLSVGLPRTGSYSMCLALSELGYKDVYHCMHTLDNLEHWMFFGEASNRLFPTLQSYNGKGMVAEDWDQLFGPCEAITDIAGPFSESLIRNYPDAKVILCERPFDRWEPSVTQLLKSNFGPVQNFIRDWVEPLTRGKGQTSYVENLQKMLLGWTRSQNVDEAISNLRVIYDRHNDTVKELVPPENLLLYKLGSGWEPLCEFLGRDVPDVPFPRVNEGSALARTIWKKQVREVKRAAPTIFLYLGGVFIAFLILKFSWIYLGF